MIWMCQPYCLTLKFINMNGNQDTVFRLWTLVFKIMDFMVSMPQYTEKISNVRGYW